VQKRLDFHRYNFRPLEIDRKALNELLEVLNRNSESVEITFSDREYKYSTLAEIEPVVNIELIEIITRRPFSTLTLGKQRFGKVLLRDDNTLSTDATDKGESLFLKVRETLLKRERLLSRSFRWWIFVSSVVLNLSMLYEPWRSFLNSHLGRHAHGIVDFATSSYQLLFMYFYWRGMSVIKLTPQASVSFLKRNRDDLWKLAIAAIAGAVVTEVVHLLFSHFAH